MRTYWIVAGLGVLAVIIGGIVYMASDQQVGILVIAGGLVVAVMGLAMRLIMGAAGDKLK